MATRPECAPVRHTMVETMRSRTLAVSSTDSLWPIWASPGLMIRALPPMSAMPVAKETRVRVEVLSKITATVLRPLPSAAKGCTL